MIKQILCNSLIVMFFEQFVIPTPLGGPLPRAASFVYLPC
jgi:hypothetical protein